MQYAKKAVTLVKTCEAVSEMRECRAPRDWSLLALQNIRTGKSHYLVICRCPETHILGKFVGKFIFFFKCFLFKCIWYKSDCRFWSIIIYENNFYRWRQYFNWTSFWRAFSYCVVKSLFSPLCVLHTTWHWRSDWCSTGTLEAP